VTPIEIALHIKVVPAFDRLTNRQLVHLARVVKQETVGAGSVVFHENDDGHCMYLIIDGDLEVRTGNTLLNTLGPRSFFGEMALFEDHVRSASVVARTRARLLRLERADLLALLEEIPGISIPICESLSRRVRELNERIDAEATEADGAGN